MGGKAENKAAYFDKLKALLEEYKSIFIVTVDNVSSQQMHKIRKSLRSGGDVTGVVLMGKNTMVRLQFADRTRLVCWTGTDHLRFEEPSKDSLPTSLNMSVFFLTSKVTHNLATSIPTLKIMWMLMTI